MTRRPGTAARQEISTPEIEPGRYDSLARTRLLALQRSVGNQAVLRSLAIQRVLTAGTAFNDLAVDADAVRFATIRQHYQQYGQAAAAVNAAQPAGLRIRFERLRLLDEAVFDWFNQQHTDDLMGLPNAARMRTLLQDSERERDAVVGALIAANAPIPLANLQGGENRAGIEAIWTRLSTGVNSRLRVHTQGAGGATDRTKLLSQLAAAMQTPTGRRFITFLVNDAPADVWVAFEDAVQTQGAGAFAGEATPGGPMGLQVDVPSAQTKLRTTAGPAPIGAPVLANTAVAFLSQLVSETVANAGAGQPARIAHAGQVISGNQPREAAAIVTRKQVLADNRSKLSTTHGDEILTPTFITLMHELGHALKLAFGIYMPDDDQLMAHFRAQLPDAQQAQLWQRLEGNPNMLEELVNVLGFENPIRSESGLRERDVYQSPREVRLIPLKNSVEARLNQILGDPDVNLYLPLNPALPRHTATWYQRLNTATAAVDVAAMTTLNNDLGLALANQQNDKVLALQALLAELQAFPPGNAVSHTRIARTRRYNNLQVAINAAIAAPNVNAAQLTPLTQDLTALKHDRALLIKAGQKIRSHQKGNILGVLFNTVHEGGAVGTYNL